ncbi:flagellar biosynthesis protein FlgA [Amycolatopsis aidingensis]|uniref:flagellar biosynthesis protein FlgA n=1 Tax=Amycolatopsis aidingensis TaxID=2842453 RepID=UPI001E4479F6|nr:flagellar biosynthesis protein FlgA [Amycolatopsis aidingensis]
MLTGLVLSALCTTGVVWVFHSGDATVSAVGVASPVRYGQTITEGALREVRVRPDPGLRPVPWDQRSQLVGKPATTDLIPGGIVTPEAVRGELPPIPGQQLVGVAVKPAQAPATPLRPRQPVLLVPSSQGGSGAEEWEPVRGTVLRVGERDAGGLRVVDVVVPERSGPRLATRASAGTVAIVLLPGG